MNAPYEIKRLQDQARRNCIRVEWLLRHRSRFLARVVPDDGSPLYRVQWPDIGPSPTANLSRCMDAAHQWAERSHLTEHRKNGAARSLKSLDNFSWSRSLVRLNGSPVVRWPGGAK